MGVCRHPVRPPARPARQRACPGVHAREDAVRQGFDEIQHINQVLLNFFVKPKDDTRTLARFYHCGRERPRTEPRRVGGARVHRAAAARADRHRSHAGVLRGAVRSASGRNEPELRLHRRASARRVSTEPPHQFDGCQRDQCGSLPQVVCQDGRIRRHDAPRGHTAGGRYRRRGRLHAAPGARALRAGRHPAGRSPSHRDLERREVHPHPRPAGFDHTRKAGRLDPRRWRSNSRTSPPSAGSPSL